MKVKIHKHQYTATHRRCFEKTNVLITNQNP